MSAYHHGRVRPLTFSDEHKLDVLKLVTGVSIEAAFDTVHLGTTNWYSVALPSDPSDLRCVCTSCATPTSFDGWSLECTESQHRVFCEFFGTLMASHPTSPTYCILRDTLFFDRKGLDIYMWDLHFISRPLGSNL
jgi:hypothetical protein